MFPAFIVLSMLFAAFLVYSAAGKVTRKDYVVESMTNAGISLDWLNYLAVVLIAGAAGLVAGLFWAPLGIVAAASLALYFLFAIGFHVRYGDAKHAPFPGIMVAVASAILILNIAS